jgi:putative transposase
MIENKEWYSVKEFATLENIPVRTVKWKCANNKLIVRASLIDKGGKNGMAYEISRESLSMQAIINLQVNDEKTIEIIKDWPEWKTRKAMEKLRIIEAVANTKIGKNKTERLKAVAQKNNITFVTAQNWYKAYIKHGIAGLAPSWGKLNGNCWSIPQELQQLIKSSYLRPAQPFKFHVYKDVEKWCKDNNAEPPSYRTVCRFIETGISEADKMLFRIGKRAYRDKYEPVIRRDFDDLAVNEMWVLDHREFDIFVYTDDRRIKYARPWISAQMDLKTRCLVGWQISFQPNSNTAALGMRHGILNYGKPDGVYLDNGKDYRSKFLNGKTKKIGKIDFDLRAQGVFARLNIKPRFAWPYSGRSKPIESFFRNFPIQFERYLPGWCGCNNKERPEKLNQEIKDGKLITVDELRQLVVKFLAEYNNREHSETGIAPNEAYKGALITRIDEDALALLLMKGKESITYWNDGLHLHNARYRNLELNRLVKVGEKVDVFYNPGDMNVIYVYKDGNYLCKVPIEGKFSMHASEEDFKYMAKLRKDARAQISRTRQNYKFVYSMENALEAAKEMRQKLEPEAPLETSPAAAAKVVAMFGANPAINEPEPEPIKEVKKQKLFMEFIKTPEPVKKEPVFLCKKIENGG